MMPKQKRERIVDDSIDRDRGFSDGNEHATISFDYRLQKGFEQQRTGDACGRISRRSERGEAVS
jgi:hypothetical protein